MPEPSESFKVEARLPWSGEYRHIKDDRDLQYLFNHFREKKIDTVRIDVVLISLLTSVLTAANWRAGDGCELTMEDRSFWRLKAGGKKLCLAIWYSD
ncbi:hypothetical protein LWI29_013030 [Acer saccharum]|uniref:Uncharacterized protein n=1 Tax=Acer saccharum TaxID=4024 RepID=A0AA39V8D8_ACESA|nr:hypothetical protein LWI29_013030 [Acer saccharum]